MNYEVIACTHDDHDSCSLWPRAYSQGPLYCS